MKTLILGTSYVGKGAQGYGANMVTLWAKLAMKLNPDYDILLVDSCSPDDPTEFLKPLGFVEFDLCGAFTRRVFRFSDNIGHLNVTGKDGWGRAFCKGIEIAIEQSYDYVCYMDADIIFARPVSPIIDKLSENGVKAACPYDTTYNFLENGLMFLDVEYLKESKFIERYDWQGRNGIVKFDDVPELAFERLLDPVIFTLPLRGLRDDFNRITVNNLSNAFPYGVDYLTHVKDFGVYKRLVEMKGIEL